MKNNTAKPIVLLDSHAIIHRAYHALPDFTSPQGEPTGALYGLSTMLLKLIEDLDPYAIIACFDRKEATYRHEVFSDYKGTREKTDDDLVHQLERARDVMRAFGIPVVDKAGFEADDLLGTLARVLKEDHTVIIASGDMDTLQLVDGRKVMVYTLKRGLSDTVLYDEKAVHEKYGFSPKYVPDYKGFAGDTSDNIKGVPGIGGKTATDLITKIGSVEDVYALLEKGDEGLLKKSIKPRTILLLREHKEAAILSKMLGTIHEEVPIDIPDIIPLTHALQHERILELFDELHFRSLKDRFLKMIGRDTLVRDALLEQEAVVTDERAFREAQIMLWLLDSDHTNPSLNELFSYTGKDSFLDAYDALSQALSQEPRLLEVYENIERPLIEVISKMEERGVLIDVKALTALSDSYTKELEHLTKTIHSFAGREFNVNSPRQLGDVLFDDLNLAPKHQKKTATGQRSTKESELEKIKESHPIVPLVLEHRELQKLLSTYIDAIPQALDKENRLHTHFLQTGTTTGRMASVDPNLQNIPIKTPRGYAIRHAFIASPGYSLVALDYSQVELRIAAFLSRDEKLIDIFVRGEDIHRAVAADIFRVAEEDVDREMRRRAKVINFGILYGMGVNALKTSLNTTQGEAQQFLSTYFDTYTGLKEYVERVRGEARIKGYTETLFGRRRMIPGITSDLPGVRAQAERIAVNAPMQGTQADIIKIAMARADAEFSQDAHLLLQVHDELVYEIEASDAVRIGREIKTIMETVLSPEDTCGVPLIADMKVGKNWGDMEPIE